MQNLYKFRGCFFQFWGILILVIVALGNQYLDYRQLNSVSASLGGLAIIANILLYRRYRTVNFMVFLASVALMEFALVRTLFPVLETISTTISVGVFLFFNLLFIYNSEDKVRRFFAKEQTDFRLSMFRNNVLYEFFHLSMSLLYLVSIFTSALIVVNVYSVNYPGLYKFFNYDLIVILLVLLFLYEVIRMQLIHSRLSMEIWYPIITEDLQTVGRIARSESLKNGTLYLHPHVRVVLVCRNQLFLQTGTKSVLTEGRIDIPISDDMFFGETLEQAVARMVNSRFPALGKTNARPRFVVYNRFTSEQADRIVFHYILEIDERALASIDSALSDGKFWPLFQIHDNLKQGRFSTCFEQELDVIENYLIV